MHLIKRPVAEITTRHFNEQKQLKAELSTTALFIWFRLSRCCLWRSFWARAQLYYWHWRMDYLVSLGQSWIIFTARRSNTYWVRVGGQHEINRLWNKWKVKGVPRYTCGRKSVCGKQKEV